MRQRWVHISGVGTGGHFHLPLHSQRKSRTSPPFIRYLCPYLTSFRTRCSHSCPRSLLSKGDRGLCDPRTRYQIHTVWCRGGAQTPSRLLGKRKPKGGQVSYRAAPPLICPCPVDEVRVYGKTKKHGINKRTGKEKTKSYPSVVKLIAAAYISSPCSLRCCRMPSCLFLQHWQKKKKKHISLKWTLPFWRHIQCSRPVPLTIHQIQSWVSPT